MIRRDFYTASAGRPSWGWPVSLLTEGELLLVRPRRPLHYEGFQDILEPVEHLPEDLSGLLVGRVEHVRYFGGYFEVTLDIDRERPITIRRDLCIVKIKPATV